MSAFPEWLHKSLATADEMLDQQGYAHTDLRAARDWLRENDGLILVHPDTMRLAESLQVEVERLRAERRAKDDWDGLGMPPLPQGPSL